MDVVNSVVRVRMMAVKEPVLLSLRKHKVHPRESDSDCLARLLVRLG